MSAIRTEFRVQDLKLVKRYFDLFKHLCAGNVIAVLVAVALYRVIQADVLGLLVLVFLGTSLIFAVGGMNNVLDHLADGRGWHEKSLRHWCSLSAATLILGLIGLVTSIVW